MKGQLLSYDAASAWGLIAGEDGRRYGFNGGEWKSPVEERRFGATIDFVAAESNATEIYAIPAPVSLAKDGVPAPVPPHAFPADEKSNVAAGLLAIFLGPLGIHKFYMGYQNEGIILLVGSVISFFLVILLVGIFGLIAIRVITLVEGIIYLAMPQQRFVETYVTNKKPWF